jgi:hypothetical protein
VDFAGAEVEGGLDGFGEAGALVGGEGETVLGDEKVVGGGEGRGVGEEFVDASGGVGGRGCGISGEEDADVGLALKG